MVIDSYPIRCELSISLIIPFFYKFWILRKQIILSWN